MLTTIIINNKITSLTIATIFTMVIMLITIVLIFFGYQTNEILWITDNVIREVSSIVLAVIILYSFSFHSSAQKTSQHTSSSHPPIQGETSQMSIVGA